MILQSVFIFREIIHIKQVLAHFNTSRKVGYHLNNVRLLSTFALKLAKTFINKCSVYMAKISDIVKGAAFYKCTMDHLLLQRKVWWPCGGKGQILQFVSSITYQNILVPNGNKVISN